MINEKALNRGSFFTTASRLMFSVYERVKFSHIHMYSD